MQLKPGDRLRVETPWWRRVRACLASWRDADPAARRALVAASLGWMLDAFDVMLYALVLSAVRTDLSLTREVAGGLQSLTLLASAAGGLLFGVLADRWGRIRALMLSVLIYSVFTAACGLAQTALQLAVFRLSSASAWAASGRAALRSCPKPGRRAIAAKRSA
jgi:MFS family permease